MGVIKERQIRVEDLPPDHVVELRDSDPALYLNSDGNFTENISCAKRFKKNEIKSYMNDKKYEVSIVFERS